MKGRGYRLAFKVLNQVEAYRSFMGNFVSANRGYNFGTKQDGKYSDVKLNFNVNNEIKAGSEKANGNTATTSIQFLNKQTGQWELFDPENYKGDGKDLNLRVNVELYYLEDDINGIPVVNHEIVAHAEEQAQIVQNFQKNRNINALKKEMTEKLNPAGTEQDHDKIGEPYKQKEGFNGFQTFEDINMGALEIINQVTGNSRYQVFDFKGGKQVELYLSGQEALKDRIMTHKATKGSGGIAGQEDYDKHKGTYYDRNKAK